MAYPNCNSFPTQIPLSKQILHDISRYFYLHLFSESSATPETYKPILLVVLPQMIHPQKDPLEGESRISALPN